VNMLLFDKILDRFKGHKLKDVKKEIVHKWLLRNYLGHEYHCPICNSNLARFKPIWKSYMRNIKEKRFIYPLSSFETFNVSMYLCPSCDASDRERLYALFLLKQFENINIKQKYRFVDFAPTLALSKWIRKYPFIHYTTADLFRKNVDDRVDITDMVLYGNNSIDIFICSHILEHIPDEKKALGELFRVLKPGGFGIVMVPIITTLDCTHEDTTITNADERWKYFGQDDHLRLHAKIDFVNSLEEVGFNVKEYDINWFGPDIYRKHGIHENSILYVVEK